MSVKLGVAIAWRYLRSSRDFLKSVALLAMLGLALSVAILLVVQAVVSGFEYELKNRVLGIMAHVEIISFQENGVNLDIVEDLEAHVSSDFNWASEVHSLVLVAADPSAATFANPAANTVESVFLKGIDPIQYQQSSTLFEYVRGLEGSAELQSGSFKIFLGNTIAQRLRVNIGDSVVVLLMEPTVSLLGLLPRQKKFELGGIIETRTLFDSSLALIHIDDARKFLRTDNSASAIQIQLENPFDALNVASTLNYEMEDTTLYASSWMHRFGYLYQSIQTSKYLLLFVFSLLVGVAAFNLVSTVVVFVRERVRDIAIYRTLGSTRTFIAVIFLTTALLISVLGLVLGCLLGWVLGMLLEAVLPLINSLLGTNLLEEYFVTTLNVHFKIVDVVRVCLLGLGLALLASLVPAYRATRTDPAEVLRYE